VETSTSTPTPNTVSEPLISIEQLKAQSKYPHYLIAAAGADKRWLPGQELTQAAFDQAIQDVAGSVI